MYLNFRTEIIVKHFHYNNTSRISLLYDINVYVVQYLICFTASNLCVLCVLLSPQNFQAYADVLTDGLKDRHLWWGGWDIARRIPFVFCSFFVAIARPSLILVRPLIIFIRLFLLFFQFFMSIAALIVMIVHVFIKPYKKEYINIIEAAILLDLLLVTGAFLDPSSEQVPDWFAYILVFLPYIYCIGYFCWLIGKRIK